MHQTLCSQGTTTCIHESSWTFLSAQVGSRLSSSACFAPVPCHHSWWAGVPRGPFCWLQVEAGVVIASRAGWLCSEMAGLRLPGLDLFFHLGFSAPSPNALLVPEPPRRCPSAPPAVLCSHLGVKPLSHLIASVPMDTTAAMLCLCLPYLQPPWPSMPQKSPRRR